MLPLQGKASVIPPPPPDTHKRGPMLARIAERDAPIISAWASKYPSLYFPSLVPEESVQVKKTDSTNETADE